MRPVFLSALVLVLGVPKGALFTPQAGQEGEGQGPTPARPLFPEAEDPAEQMKQLFSAVERNLQRIDALLNDASAGVGGLSDDLDSGLAKLLEETQESSRSAVQDIDRILELARQQGQRRSSNPSQGQGQGQGKPENSPLDQPRESGPRQGESTPESPSQPEHKEQGAGKPESPTSGKDPGATRPGQPEEPKPGKPVPPGTDADEWGMLPPKVQEIFRHEGGEDLPVQYRDWIDAYYRRLNRSGR
jgi:hypothetical protein